MSAAVERSFPWPPDESKNRNRMAAKDRKRRSSGVAGVREFRTTNVLGVIHFAPGSQPILNSRTPGLLQNMGCGGSCALTAFPLVSRLDVSFGSD